MKMKKMISVVAMFVAVITTIFVPMESMTVQAATKVKETKVNTYYADMKPFSEGLAAVYKGCDKYGRGGKWGFINKKGEEVIKCQFDEVCEFQEGLAMVVKNDKWGVINKKGKVIVKYREYKWNWLYGGYSEGYSEGLAPIYDYKTLTWGYMDKKGKLVIPYQYSSAGAFGEGLAGVVKDGKHAYINSKGEAVITFDTEYDSVSSFVDGRAFLFNINEYIMVDKTGKKIASYYNLGSGISNGYGEGLIGYNNGENTYFMDKNGKALFSLTGYNAVLGSQDGRILISKYKNGKYSYGYADKTGKIVIACKYGDAVQFSEGLAAVKKGNKYGIIDKSGKTVVSFKYDNPNRPNYTQVAYGSNFTESFHDGLARMKKGKTWYILEKVK